MNCYELTITWTELMYIKSYDKGYVIGVTKVMERFIGMNGAEIAENAINTGIPPDAVVKLTGFPTCGLKEYLNIIAARNRRDKDH